MTQKPKLTPRQQQVLGAVAPSSGGFDPRTDQVARRLDAFTSAVYGPLRALERKGFVMRSHDAPIRWRRT